jgi:hypothetical protein
MQLNFKHLPTSETNQSIFYPFGAPERTRVFSGVCVARSLVFYIMFGRSLFVLLSFFLLTIVLSVLRFTVSEYPFGIFKHFLSEQMLTSLIIYSNALNDPHYLFATLSRFLPINFTCSKRLLIYLALQNVDCKRI